MSTDYQQGRVSLGVRLRELRTEAGLRGQDVADRCRWAKSKVSKLENGRQTPTPADLDAWAAAVGQPGAAKELRARLRGIETQYRSWRRQLATGHKVRQEVALAEQRRSQTIRLYESAVIPGLFQTPGYARHLLIHNARLRRTPLDTEEAVRARMKRQDMLYEPGHLFRALVWEGALRAMVCPPEVMAGQLDRLAGLVGLDTVEFGVIPFAAALTVSPRHGFWIYDDRLVIVETINAEMWLDDRADIDLYSEVWGRLDEAALYGRDAQRLLAGIRTTIEAT